jgi:tetratricopeptide (TPR) repeat protein
MAYLVNMVYPADLSPYYPYPRTVSYVAPEYLLPAVAVIGLTAGSIALARRRRLWLAAWGYYVITLLPVLGIVQVGGQAMADRYTYLAMADRYTYLPSLAPFLLCGAGVAWISARTRDTGLLRGLLAAVAAGAVIVLSIATVRQIGIWKDGIGLWTHIIEKDDAHAPLSYVNRGHAYQRAGDLRRAVEDFSTAIRLNPQYVNALYARGTAYRMGGDLDGAIDDFTRVLALGPGLKEAYAGRAGAYDARGQADLAIEDYGKAIEIDPRDAILYALRGMAFKKKGLFERAISDYAEALRLDPASAETYNNRGVAYKHLRRFDQAVEDYSRAIALDPSFGLAYCNRGIVLGMMGRPDEALQDLTAALSLQPDLVRAYLERATLHARAGRRKEAELDLQQACDRGSEEGCAAAHAYGRQQAP